MRYLIESIREVVRACEETSEVEKKIMSQQQSAVAKPKEKKKTLGQKFEEWHRKAELQNMRNVRWPYMFIEPDEMRVLEKSIRRIFPNCNYVTVESNGCYSYWVDANNLIYKLRFDDCELSSNLSQTYQRKLSEKVVATMHRFYKDERERELRCNVNVNNFLVEFLPEKQRIYVWVAYSPFGRWYLWNELRK